MFFCRVKRLNNLFMQAVLTEIRVGIGTSAMVSQAGAGAKHASSASNGNGAGANWHKRQGGERRGAEEDGRCGSNGAGSVRPAAAPDLSRRMGP
jgi:hypothetical protein